MADDRIDVLFACGEFIPGTKSLKDRPIKTPGPPKIIPINRRVITVPRLPRRDDDDLPARNPGPGSPGGRGGSPPGPGAVPPGPGPTTPGGVNPTTPGPGPTTPGGNLGPTTPGPGPTTPGNVGPTTPGPGDTPPPTSTPTGPTTPGPGGGGGDPPDEEPPRRFSGDPTLTYALPIPPIGLEDEGRSGGGGGSIGEPIINTRAIGLRDGSNNNSLNGPSEGEVIAFEQSLSNIQQGSTGTGNFAGSRSTTNYDLRDNSGRSMFSNSFNNNNLYDPIYNILDHSNSPTTFVSNNKYRNIFGNRVTTEVNYFLNSLNLQYNWEERFITGLTIEKLTRSLNNILLEAFDTIVDINGIPVTRNHFLSKVFGHLISGTLDEFDDTFYIKLADSISSKNLTTITNTRNEQTKKNQVLSLMSNSSYAIDYSRYTDRQQIELARMRFLLTDLESTFDIETIDGTEYQLELEDAGVEVEYAPTLGLVENASVSSDYVPPGEGDGYYYKIETELGQLLPLVLDTQIDKAFYITNDTRRLALKLLDVDSSYTFTTTVNFIDSEFSSGFSTEYTASAHYFKLDLRTIDSTPTRDSFVENIVATYVKLTDPEEIAEHSKTYGAKVTQFNIQYDDPFLQYADRSGAVTINMNDVTFRQFVPKRTPSNNSIITRNLPDGFVLYPVTDLKDNPTGGLSEFQTVADQVTRRLVADIDFTLDEIGLSRRALRETLVWDGESSYSYGLVGIKDTQNVYYVYNQEDFPNTFQVQERSPEGNLIYNILEQKLKQRYSFDYLTWWDLYRRLSAKEFSKLIFSMPNLIVDKLYLGWLGTQAKDVLYRNGQAPDNLTEVNTAIDDLIYLDGRDRNNV